MHEAVTPVSRPLPTWRLFALSRSRSQQVISWCTVFSGFAFLIVTLVAWATLRQRDLLDDAYTTAHYAQNLAQGHGWVWNVGATPSDGTTAPLWTLILAGVLALHVPFVSSVLWLNALCYGVAALAACRLAGEVAGRLAAVICLLGMVAFTVFLPRCAGMETPFYMAVLFLSIFAWHRGSLRLALFLAGVLPLVRGDGALLLVAFGAELVVERRVRELLPVIVLALVPLACWELFSLWQFHALLPNSYLAKHAASSGNGIKIDPSTFLFGVWARSDSIWLYVVVLLAVAIRFFTPAVRLISLWLVLYYVFYSFLSGVPQFMWYTAPFWWGLPVLFGIGAVRPLHDLDRAKPLFSTVRLFPLVSTLLGLATAPALLWNTINATDTYHIEYLAATTYLAAHPGGTVAAAEIGYAGYYSHHPIVDIQGLVNPDVVPHLARHDYTWVLKTYRPRYVFLFLPMPDGSCSLELTCAIWHSAWFRQHYAVVWQYLHDPDKPDAILAAR